MNTLRHTTYADFLNRCESELTRLIKKSKHDDFKTAHEFHYDVFMVYSSIAQEIGHHNLNKNHLDDLLCILWVTQENAHPRYQHESIEKMADKIVKAMHEMFGDLTGTKFQQYILNSQLVATNVLFIIENLDELKFITQLLACFWDGRDALSQTPTTNESAPVHPLHTQQRAAG